MSQILTSKDERNVKNDIIESLELQHIIDRKIDEMGGGELQRFAIAATVIQKADIYMFDEPTLYLDIRQRLVVAKLIRQLLSPERCVVVVDHDLSIMDYLCDFVCCLYGTPGTYGIVSMPFGVREGINVFLNGYLPDEHLRFRNLSVLFHEPDTNDKEEAIPNDIAIFSYPELVKQLGTFHLKVLPGSFSAGQVICVMGQNGVGKTTFLRMLAKVLVPDNGAVIPDFQLSYKPQNISPRFEGTIRELFQSKINEAFINAQFEADVIKLLHVNTLLDQEVCSLSGGELQRVALVLLLGKPADVYLIDEPSSYLDCEYRIIAARVIKRFMRKHKKTAFVVEHDFTMATFLADRIIIYEGKPCCDCLATPPLSVLAGLNRFLKSVEVTGERDAMNFRIRVNKLNSTTDQQQKQVETWFVE